MSNEKEIFEGKTFQDLTKDIYENTTKRKTQIDLLISEIHGFITTIDDVGIGCTYNQRIYGYGCS